jgi:hypothetical protein
VSCTLSSLHNYKSGRALKSEQASERRGFKTKIGEGAPGQRAPHHHNRQNYSRPVLKRGIHQHRPGAAQRNQVPAQHLASHLPQPGGHGQERTRAGSFGLRRTGAAFSSRRPLRQVFKVAKGLTCHRSYYSYRSGLWKVLNISTRRLEVGSRESERWGWCSFLFCGSSEFSGCWFWRA